MGQALIARFDLDVRNIPLRVAGQGAGGGAHHTAAPGIWK
jgi:hypothetical protein